MNSKRPVLDAYEPPKTRAKTARSPVLVSSVALLCYTALEAKIRAQLAGLDVMEARDSRVFFMAAVLTDSGGTSDVFFFVLPGELATRLQGDASKADCVASIYLVQTVPGVPELCAVLDQHGIGAPVHWIEELREQYIDLWLIDALAERYEWRHERAQWHVTRQILEAMNVREAPRGYISSSRK